MNFWIVEAIGIALQIGAIMLAVKYAPGSFSVLVAVLIAIGFVQGLVSSRLGAASSMSGMPKSTAAWIVAGIAGLAPFAFTIYNYGFLRAIGAALLSFAITAVAALVF
jgi:hypothetical protein